MGLSAVGYALAKKYTDETAHQFGGLKGAPCKVKSASKENGRTTIILEWKNDEGDTRETSFYVDDGSSIWVSGKEYKVNDIIVYNDIIYVCEVENSDTVFNENKWTPITGSGSVNGYFNLVDNLFYKESTYVTPIVGNENTIYISIDTNKIYRYNGTIFIGLSADGGGGGTTVVANPSGPATDDLEKLQVGSIVYAVNGGGNTFSLNGERLIIS